MKMSNSKVKLFNRAPTNIWVTTVQDIQSVK